MIIVYDLFQELTVDIVALERLCIISLAEDVATGFKPSVHQSDPWSVLKITKRETLLDVLRAVDIRKDEEVRKALV